MSVLGAVMDAVAVIPAWATPLLMAIGLGLVYLDRHLARVRARARNASLDAPHQS